MTWDAYELFRVGEQGKSIFGAGFSIIKISDSVDANAFTDSNYARDAFATFLPLSVETDARAKIIFDFFDLLAAIAAHGKSNGMAGRKLSRFAGWWAFDHHNDKDGFDGGYRSWTK